MRISIINPAPIGANLTKWGDYHFGGALARSLERLNAVVTQHFWPEWNVPSDADLVIALRGKRAFAPPAGKLSFLWIISHPAAVSFEETARYDLVLTASETHRRLLDGGDISTRTLRQCTEGPPPHRTLPGQKPARRGVVFVGNSRGVARPILRWCIQAGVIPDIIGRQWNDVGLSRLVSRSFIPNEELLEFYAGVRLCLNDHWGDMRHYGYINNRIFDALSVGTPILTDHFPELEEVCGSNILYANGPDSVRSAMERYYFEYPALEEQARELWGKIGNDHTFDRRAAELLSFAEQLPSRREGRGENALLRERHPLVTAVCNSIVASAPSGTEVRVLHLCPSPELTQALSACDGINYLSAGLGVGPWHVSTDVSVVGLLRKPGYDFVLIEEGGWSANLSDGEMKMLLESARALTRVGGRTYLVGKRTPRSDSISRLVGFLTVGLGASVSKRRRSGQRHPPL